MAPVRLVVPAPTWLSAPVPEMTLAMVTAFERLTSRVALSTTAPVPRAPVVPPAPTLSVPAEMVVVPE